MARTSHSTSLEKKKVSGTTDMGARCKRSKAFGDWRPRAWRLQPRTHSHTNGSTQRKIALSPRAWYTFPACSPRCHSRSSEDITSSNEFQRVTNRLAVERVSFRLLSQGAAEGIGCYETRLSFRIHRRPGIAARRILSCRLKVCRSVRRGKCSSTGHG